LLESPGIHSNILANYHFDMIEYGYNDIHVIRVHPSELPDKTSDILSRMRSKGIFEKDHIFRSINSGSLDRILSTGTDRSFARDLKYWLNIIENPAAQKACRSCTDKYSSEEIVNDTNFGGLAKKIIICNSQEITKVNNARLHHHECPIYMSLASSSDVIWGRKSRAEGLVLSHLQFSKTSKTRYIMVYPASALNPFDIDKYQFRNKTPQNLSMVIEFMTDDEYHSPVHIIGVSGVDYDSFDKVLKKIVCEPSIMEYLGLYSISQLTSEQRTRTAFKACQAQDIWEAFIYAYHNMPWHSETLLRLQIGLEICQNPVYLDKNYSEGLEAMGKAYEKTIVELVNSPKMHLIEVYDRMSTNSSTQFRTLVKNLV